ncbi:MAG TPA: AAA family ATPase, partial [Bacteroidota bacterium]|nr:AAA family ATPase [Bacteroidota bacterium]
GKTTVVKLFAEKFQTFISLNLDVRQEREIFERNYSAAELLSAIYFLKNIPRKDRTLLFIDEIQSSPAAVAMLRYLHEDTPDIYVIAAGSLLESLMDTHISFPVGRVEYLKVHPCSFREFLGAMGETQSLEFLQQTHVPDYAHGKLQDLFRLYTLTGGMPEIVQHYATHRDLTALTRIYEGLLASYLDDVEKYARNTTMTNIIRHTIRQSLIAAGSRIKFQGFGHSNYKSREVGEAFRTLEKTMLLQLVYSTASTSLPIQLDRKKSPKLQLLDTGLTNFVAGLQGDVFGSDHIDDVHEGRIAEHIAGQELMALQSSPMSALNFWTREEKQSNAEVDFVWRHEDLLIPIEVKSGAEGRLRSLHQFIDRAPHPYAVRICSGKFSVNQSKTISGKHFILINLPFYLISRLDESIRLGMAAH